MSKRESFPGDKFAAFNDYGQVIVAARGETHIHKSEVEGVVIRPVMTVVVLAVRQLEITAPKPYTSVGILSGIYGHQFSKQAIKLGRKNAHFEYFALLVPEDWTADAYAEALIAHAAKSTTNIGVNAKGERRVVLPFGMAMNAAPDGNRPGRLFGAVTFTARNGELTTQVHLMSRAFSGTALKRAHEALANFYGFGDGAINGDWVTFTKVEDHTPDKYAVPNSGVEPTVNFVYRGYAQPIQLLLKGMVPGQSARPKKAGSKTGKK